MNFSIMHNYIALLLEYLHALFISADINIYSASSINPIGMIYLCGPFKFLRYCLLTLRYLLDV